MSFIPITPVSNRWILLQRGIFLRGIVTLSMIAAALGFTETLWLMVDRPVSSPLFLLAIVLTAWICGFRFGIFAAIVSGVVIDYLFVTAQAGFSGSRDELFRLLVFVLEGGVLAWLVERLRLAGEAINISNQQLQALTERQQNLREEEQKRIAREVHDELGQALTGLKMNIHLLKRRAQSIDENNSLADGLDDLMQQTDATIGTVRRIASELRPSLLDDFGLVAAIEWQTQEFARRTSIACEFKSASEIIDLGSEKNTAMYRIVQEALTNIARHAQASQAAVDLDTTENEVTIRISDNGVGISSFAGRGSSLGIIGMQERGRIIGAELTIDSPLTGGTSVNLRLPLNGNGHPQEKSATR
jgi:signal transduction histidine kinase